MRARISVSLCALVLCALLSRAADAAAPSAGLHVGLSPERPGASTTLSFGFTIAAAGQALPPALTTLRVQLPAGMGVELNGVQTCTRKALLARGRQGCSIGAQVGSGSVIVRVPLGNVIRTETAVLTVFNGPRLHGDTTLLFYAAGRLPIATQLVFAGVIVPSAAGPSIDAAIPLIPTLPEAPDAAIVAMSSTIGTRQRSYFVTIDHRRERISPKGATLPGSCPAGGLPFSASFGFNDSAAATAATQVACPR